MKCKIGLCRQKDPYDYRPCSLAENTYGLAIAIYNHKDEFYAFITVNFGEYICIKNAAYLDINFKSIIEDLENMGVAHKTGFTIGEYPLYQFSEEFLKSLPEINPGYGYDKYEACYNKKLQLMAMEVI